MPNVILNNNYFYQSVQNFWETVINNVDETKNKNEAIDVNNNRIIHKQNIKY